MEKGSGGRVLAAVKVAAGQMGMSMDECMNHCMKFATNMKGDMSIPEKMMAATKMVPRIKGKRR